MTTFCLMDIFWTAYAGAVMGCATCIIGIPIALAVYDRWLER